MVPFVACGDLSGFDADRSYPLQLGGGGAAAGAGTGAPVGTGADGTGTAGGTGGAASASTYQYHAPVQAPIGPAYSEHVKLVRARAQPPVAPPSAETPAHPGPSACRDGPVLLGHHGNAREAAAAAATEDGDGGR